MVGSDKKKGRTSLIHAKAMFNLAVMVHNARCAAHCVPVQGTVYAEPSANDIRLREQVLRRV